MRKGFKKVIEKIHASKRFLITAHMNLEGDALGSELATYLILKKLNKKVVIYNNDVTPGIYKFLPYSRYIKNNLKEQKFDVAIFLDCSDSSRAGRVKDDLSRVGSIINIDHHISNTFFGDINWVEPFRSSASEMIYKLSEKFNIMDKNIALCLYTGIFTDTGCFTYANTSANTHKIVSNLMKYNIHPHRIYENIHSLCTPQDLEFIGRVMASLKFDSRKKVCWAKIKKWEDKSYDLTEVIFSMMRLLKGVQAFLLFKKIGKRKIRVNFRSRSKVDVNKVAQYFGGGGHRSASGTTMEDTLEGAERTVISFIRRYTNGLKNRK